jgi:hypothetical protein
VFKHGDIYPAHVLRDQYGMNAENRPFFKVAEEEVPEGLRELIPQVERWAIPCDVTRHDYFYSQPEQDISDFYHAVLPYVDLIHAWLHAQPKNVADWPRAAVHYMYFLKAHSEAYQPTEDELQARAERLAARQHTRELEGAIAAAEDAFRSKNYNLVVRLLAPFDRELDKIWTARLALARNRTTPNDVTVE